MRELTIKQKNLIKKWFKEQEPNEIEKLSGKSNNLCSTEDLTYEQWEILEEINNTEVLYQNVNGFLQDLINEDIGD